MLTFDHMSHKSKRKASRKSRMRFEGERKGRSNEAIEITDADILEEMSLDDLRLHD